MAPLKCRAKLNPFIIAITVFWAWPKNLVATPEGLFFSLGTLRSSYVAAPDESTLIAPISISARYFSGSRSFLFVGLDAAFARNRVREYQYYTYYRHAGYLGGAFGQGYWLFGSEGGARAGLYLAIKPYIYYQAWSYTAKDPDVEPPDSRLWFALTWTYMGGFQFAFNQNLSAYIEGGYGGVPHAGLGLTYWVYWSEQ